MDSMRSLNTSLPGTSPSKQQSYGPPEQLLQAFKAAALSVTKLYKTAANDQSKARSEGYQDALDELLAFLDKEDIGLSDGEGWRIRRWATERLDGRDAVSQQAESDDEADKPERGSSPILERTQSASHPSARTASPMRTDSVPSGISPPIFEDQTNTMPTSSTFTFRSPHPFPQDADVALQGLNLSDARGPALDATMVSHRSHSPSASITISRPARSNTRHNIQSMRHNTRGTTTIGRGAGQKRKINYGEFFDISNLGHGKDGFAGGGKRGRFA